LSWGDIREVLVLGPRTGFDRSGCDGRDDAGEGKKNNVFEEHGELLF
jgi:hypothetical protein